ncbi:hypothetical protein C8R45DRAFT_900914 [Mycena sanguinolenta]|nr:hypothetical protein C8R45DRAFT_900914 [Mycena sanguinolenta]
MPVIDAEHRIIYQEPKPVKVCQWVECPDAEVGYDWRKMKMCAQCNVVRYCSKSCQRLDWSEHKLYCQTPPIMDIGAWLKMHEPLFRWALIEALRLRSEPSNILHYGISVEVTRMDQLMKGVAPSHFLMASPKVIRLDAMRKFMHKQCSSLDDDAFTKGSRKILDAGGIGQGIVVFLVSGVPDANRIMYRFQYHDFHEKPLGQESSASLIGWQNVVKGVVNGEIPISLLSRRIGGPGDGASSEA